MWEERGRGARFELTPWSVVLRAGQGSTRDLEQLCRFYWYPVYAFMRRKSASAEDACDLTQGLFERLIGRDDFSAPRRELGRFRSWLLRCAQHHWINARERETAIKRGGHFPRPLRIDAEDAEERYRAEPVEELTPEELYGYRWAHTVLEQALAALRAQQSGAEALAFFDRVSELLLGADRRGRDYGGIAAEFGLSTGAVKQRVHRLQRRDLPFQLRAVLARSLHGCEDRTAEVAAELRYLGQCLELPRRRAAWPTAGEPFVQRPCKLIPAGAVTSAAGCCSNEQESRFAGAV